MKIKNYQAETVAEALAMVKRELGPNAVIMKTVPLHDQGTSRKKKSRMFQVTACVDDGALPSSRIQAFTAQPRTARSRNDDMTSIRSQIDNLRMDLRDLLRSGRLTVHDLEVPDRLRRHYSQLLGMGLDHGVIERVMAAVAGSTSEEDNSETTLLSIRDEFVRLSAGVRQIGLYAGKSTRVAFVGLPGSGKSSFIAKLATYFVTAKKASVRLVSADDFKPTATDELERYGRLLKIECLRAEESSPRRTENGLDLVDTAGVPAGNDRELTSLKENLENQHVDEIHLVIPACSNWDIVRRWVKFFSPLDVDAVAMSFMDQVDVPSLAININMSEGLPLSYISKGRTSVTDVAAAPVSEFIERILAIERPSA